MKMRVNESRREVEREGVQYSSAGETRIENSFAAADSADSLRPLSLCCIARFETAETIEIEGGNESVEGLMRMTVL